MLTAVLVADSRRCIAIRDGERCPHPPSGQHRGFCRRCHRSAFVRGLLDTLGLPVTPQRDRWKKR